MTTVLEIARYFHYRDHFQHKFNDIVGLNNFLLNVNSNVEWQGSASPIVFLRPIGITAADALRLMDVSRQVSMPVRWRMAPQGVAPDAYLIHKYSLAPSIDTSASQDSSARPGSHSKSGLSSLNSSSFHAVRKISLDTHGWHRGHPVCILGKELDASVAHDPGLAPLPFPDTLQELELGLQDLLDELIGLRMLYMVGYLAWSDRQFWPTHHLHVMHNDQLIGIIEPDQWRFHLRNGCGAEGIEQGRVEPIPRSEKVDTTDFQSFALETALWEFAKRCPEGMLQQILPSEFLKVRLTHRRLLHLKEHALGDHCVAILRTLDTQSRTADELQNTLRMQRPSLMRALSCLALVRAIKPEAQLGSWRDWNDWSAHLGSLNHWWQKIRGRAHKAHLPMQQDFRASVKS